MEKYYITSNKYSLQERKLKSGKKVYDVHLRIVTIDGIEKQKRLCGYESKSLAKAGYTLFVSENCQLTTKSVKKKKDPTKEKLLVGDLARQYLATLGNQNKYSVIYDKNNTFRIYILNKYDKTPIDNLTKEELYQWQDELWNTRNPRTGEYFSYQYGAHLLEKVWTTAHRLGYGRHFSTMKTYPITDDHYYVNTIGSVDEII